MAITLAPTTPPRVQYLRVQSVIAPREEMTKALDVTLRLMREWDVKTAASLAAPALDVERLRRQVAAASGWGNCKVGEAIAGDGNLDSAVRLVCERGPLVVRLSLDPTTRRLTNLNLVPSREQRCVP